MHALQGTTLGVMVALELFAHADSGKRTDAQPYDLAQCRPHLLNQRQLKSSVIHVAKGEKWAGAPVIAFDISESGKVDNIHRTRSSGVRDIDQRAVIWVRSRKYERRPGCGVVESNINLIVDF